MKIRSMARRQADTTVVVAFVVAVLLGAALSAQYAGWTIPEGGKDEKSPLKSTAGAVTKGKSLFAANCQRCHGPLAKGDGPESDPQSPAADLTDEFRIELNPEGVLYYKVWNGHPPGMPPFNDKLTKEEVWALVEYLKTLRKPA
jgi:cytochrome c oxidase cbb3-type subunit II